MGQGATDRHRHYESAFDDCLRRHGWPFIRVDEQKRAVFTGAKIKSFDFLVYPSTGKGWLVDVKGRSFPYDGRHGRRYWENWVTQDDLEGLRAWESVFGDDFEAVFVFAYWLRELQHRQPLGPVHPFRDERYAFMLLLCGRSSARPLIHQTHRCCFGSDSRLAARCLGEAGGNTRSSIAYHGIPHLETRWGTGDHSWPRHA